jgi:hypothetical protein
MEFTTAMLLADGGPQRTPEPEIPGRFAAMLPALTVAGPELLQITAHGQPLAATATHVTLAAENHVKFQLHYPRVSPVGLSFSPQRLRVLGEDGPYGTQITVLDFVHQRVLGQAVLFAHSEPFAVPPPPPTGVQSNSATPTPRPNQPIVLPAASADAPPPARPGDRAWLTAGLLAAGIIAWLVAWLNRRRP